jgi:hypothetical protein
VYLCIHRRRSLEIAFCGKNKFTETVFDLSLFQDDANELKALKIALAYIHIRFMYVSQYITKLESTTNFLSKIATEIKNVYDELNEINGSLADAMK